MPTVYLDNTSKGEVIKVNNLSIGLPKKPNKSAILFSNLTKKNQFWKRDKTDWEFLSNKQKEKFIIQEFEEAAKRGVTNIKIADEMFVYNPKHFLELSKLLIDRDIQQLALVLPRDHAKSTLAACAVLHRFLFATKDRPEFIAWIGEAQDQAIDNLNWIMTHIYENPAIHYYFGDLQGDKWTKYEFTLNNGCRMIAKGTSQ